MEGAVGRVRGATAGVTAVAVGVLGRFLYRLARDAHGVLAAAAIALCCLDDLVMAGVLGYAPFDTRHCCSYP